MCFFIIQNCAGNYAHRRRGRRSLRTVLTVVLPVVLPAVLPVFYVQILLSCTQCRHFAATSANVPQCAPQSGQYQFGMCSRRKMMHSNGSFSPCVNQITTGEKASERGPNLEIVISRLGVLRPPEIGVVVASAVCSPFNVATDRSAKRFRCSDLLLIFHSASFFIRTR